MADNPQTEIEIADNSSPTLATSALQTTLNTRVGDLTEAAPATDTASSGLNGRLQRIAQRLTSLIAAAGTTSVISDTTKGREYTKYSPDPSSYPGIISEFSFDYSDQVMVRGQVLSDEGSFRDNFPGTSLTRNLTGNIQWNNNSTSVTGTGSALFTTEVKSGNYIKRTVDPESAYTQVDYLFSDNQLYLTQNYLGSNGTTTGVVSNWKQFTGTGGSLNVANSILSIGVGTANGNFVGIVREGDYLPYNLSGKFSISQRIANQSIFFGFQDNSQSVEVQACFVFDGTTNTTVKCRSSSSSQASEIQETTVSLPTGDTSTQHVFSVDLTVTTVTFLIDGTVVAVHEDYIPGPYDKMDTCLYGRNAAIVTATTVACDWIGFQNIDQLEVTNGFRSEAIRTKPIDAPRSYSAAIVGLVPATNATDIFTITGSATRAIKVKNITVSGTQTTASAINLILLRRSTANTGGTSTTPTATLLDTSDVAATAIVRAYTANPTVGTLAGNINAIKQYVPTTTGIPAVEEFNFGDAPVKKDIVLRGTNQVLAVNLNGVSVAGGNFNISVEWTEE